MDKIYSRKRLIIPKLKHRSGGKHSSLELGKVSTLGYVGKSNFNIMSNKKLIKTAVIVILAIGIANRIIATIEPTMDVMCVNMAKSIANRVSSEQSTVAMR